MLAVLGVLLDKKGDHPGSCMSRNSLRHADAEKWGKKRVTVWRISFLLWNGDFIWETSHFFHSLAGIATPPRHHTTYACVQHVFSQPSKATIGTACNTGGRTCKNLHEAYPQVPVFCDFSTPRNFQTNA